MRRIIIFKLTELKYIDDNNDNDNVDNLKIGILSSKLNEIKETGNKHICIVNGHEVIGTFGELIDDINKQFCYSN